jgi:hypothetical protein
VLDVVVGQAATQAPSAVPAATAWQVPTDPGTLHDEQSEQIED